MELINRLKEIANEKQAQAWRYKNQYGIDDPDYILTVEQQIAIENAIEIIKQTI